ncbi:MAG: caspase family protein [Verrucomicrobia bacterium]|nr:caspase family protein [Verrucomicrobiota bacterium]
MAATKILCVHGVGHAEQDPHWNQQWDDVITDAFKRCNNPEPPQFGVVAYDDLFKDAPLNPAEYFEALAELLASAAWHSIAGPSAARAFGPPDLGRYASRWFAGMVVQWVVDANLRKECRAAIAAKIDQFQPDIICAHSLGTLLCYDLFTFDTVGGEKINGRTFLSFGSQIDNTFVKAKAWGGRVRMIAAKQWYHLFNHQDPAFTAEIQEPGVANFLEVVTDSPAGHSATAQGANPGYLDHPNTFGSVWQPLARPKILGDLTRALAVATAPTPHPPSHRALLIGINAYPDPANQLNGCVNDTYLVSELLQENGFVAENIRLLTDERATRDAMLDRLHWLLDDVADESYRVLYYSGHGVQIPGYGVNQQVDHLEDGLVPVDFDWVKLNAITDRDLLDVYSQLPYNTRFVAVFDCCYAGGLIRSMHSRIRTISVPPDIRHRIQRWNPATRSWEARKLGPLISGLDKAVRQDYSGQSGATYKLGRALPLRRLDDEEYNKVRDLRGHKGPFLPVVLEACRENQLSYECTNGSTINGAFTYALVHEYRTAGRRRAATSFVELTRKISSRIKRLGYEEEPQLIGPSDVIEGPVPRAMPVAHKAKRA